MRIETVGTAPPVGQASRNLAVVWPGPVTVKFRETADTPVGHSADGWDHVVAHIRSAREDASLERSPVAAGVHDPAGRQA